MASFILWVIIMAVNPCSFINSSVIASTLAAVFGSRAAVCSSRSNKSGFCAVAISNVRACRCPPESRETLVESLSSKPRSKGLSIFLYISRSSFVTPHFNPRLLPLRQAMARFSSIHMSPAVPLIGS